jgi:hypothetical protein
LVFLRGPQLAAVVRSGIDGANPRDGGLFRGPQAQAFTALLEVASSLEDNSSK